MRLENLSTRTERLKYVESVDTHTHEARGGGSFKVTHFPFTETFVGSIPTEGGSLVA